jgi:WD40 repeat protein
LRHNHTVAYVAFSTDGKRLTSGSWDHTIRFWDASSGRELTRITDREGHFSSMAISPDGRLLAAGCKDHSLRLWDAVTGAELRSFPDLDGAAGCVRFTPDGKALLTLTGSGFRLWDVATRKLQRQFPGPKDAIRSLTFAPDGKTLAGGCGNDVVLWSAITGKEQRRMMGHKDTVFSLAFAPDGKTLASGGGNGDRTVRLWDLKTGQELHRLPGSAGWVRSVAFSPDGKLLAFGNADGTIHLHDSATGREVRRLETPGQGQKWVMTLAFSPDSKTLASAGVGKSVLLWDVTTGQERPAPAGHRNEVGALAVTPDGKTLVSCADGRLIAWDASSGRARRQWSASGSAGALALTADGKTLITPSGKDIRVWDTATGRQRRLLRGHTGNVDAVAVAADGRTLASGGWQDHTIRLWDLSTGGERLVINLPRPNGLNYGDVPLAFSPDGKLLVSGSGDRVNRKVYFWEATMGKELRHLDREAVRLALSADGQTLVTTGWDGVARVWDVATLVELRQLPGAGGVLALSPDAKMLATGDTHGVIHLWELATGKERRWLAGHESGAAPGGGYFAGGVSALAFSGDGRSLFSGGGDTTALRWGVFAPGQQGSARDLEALWGQLGGEDAAGAYEAACVLLDVPDKAVGFLSGRLRPAPSADPRQVANLVADLDSPRFGVRQRASRALQEMGAAAHAELRKALAGNLSVEARRRLEALLERGTSRADPALLGRLRAVEVLEHVATPGALRLLRLLADGAPASPLTREAVASLNRLKGKQAPR